MKNFLLMLTLTVMYSVPAVAQGGLMRPGPSTAVAPGTRVAPTILPPDIPAAATDPAFPLHVHLGSARLGGANGYYHGYGSGNLLSDPLQGFDYTFSCPIGFRRNMQQDEFYQARWKQPNQQIEILMQRTGTQHNDVCALKLALKPVPFTHDTAAPLDSTAMLTASQYWVDPDVAYLKPDPDYPLQIQVLTNYRNYDLNGVHGFGNGNLLGALPKGVDYTYDCSPGFISNTQRKEFYQARWVKPNQRLEILALRTGSDKVDHCQLIVTLKDHAYAVNPAAANAALANPAQTTAPLTPPQP